MCGIAGLLLHRPDALKDPEAAVAAMCARLVHRGPDGGGAFSLPPAYLGHRRLSIIDIAGGNQPMVGTSGAVITFNGEIYNYRELREQLEARGHRFRTESDTEVLLQAFEADGESCLEGLNGMFAFAIWCPRRRQLFLARDRMGEKPLYYIDRPDVFAFASELKGLLAVPELAAGLDTDPQALSDFLSLGYILQPKSVYRQVRQLPPGHAGWVAADAAGLKAAEYWSAHEAFLDDKLHPGEATRQGFAELLADSVRLRLRADVQVASFLSGGVDSAAVLATAARIAPTPPLALGMGFDEPSFDESAIAARTAAHLGVPFERLTAPGATDTDSLGRLVRMFDEPFADTSIIPMRALTAEAARQVKVALSGDGADELLAGYPTYRADRYYRCYRRLPATLQAAASGAANTLLRPSYRKVSTDYKVRQFLASRGLSTERAHYWWRVIFAEAEKRRLMTADLLAEIGDYDPFDAFRDAFSRVERASFLDRALYVDSVTWLPSDILVKVDRTSMAHGLEVRTPFLDHRLVEYCARLPAEMKMVGGRQKVVLRDALRNVLPDDVLDGPKHGFNAPTLPLSRTIPGRASVSAGLAAGFTLDSRREDITFKGFALSILETWLTLGNLQGHI